MTRERKKKDEPQNQKPSTAFYRKASSQPRSTRSHVQNASATTAPPPRDRHLHNNSRIDPRHLIQQGREHDPRGHSQQVLQDDNRHQIQPNLQYNTGAHPQEEDRPRYEHRTYAEDVDVGLYPRPRSSHQTRREDDEDTSAVPQSRGRRQDGPQVRTVYDNTQAFEDNTAVSASPFSRSRRQDAPPIDTSYDTQDSGHAGCYETASPALRGRSQATRSDTIYNDEESEDEESDDEEFEDEESEEE